MRIKSAAVKFLHTGKVYTGPSHARIRAIMFDDGIDVFGPGAIEDGFITDCGRFVIRKAAARIAVKAGQVKGDDVERPWYGLMSDELLPEGDKEHGEEERKEEDSGEDDGHSEKG